MIDVLYYEADLPGLWNAIDRVFLWQGDTQIMLAMVKYVEDRLNVASDTGVRSRVTGSPARGRTARGDR